MKRMNSSAPFIVSPGSVPMGGGLELREPTRAATVESELIVPAGQAAFTALLVLLLAADVCFVPWPWAGLGGLFLGVLLALWLALVVDGRKALWRLERSIGLDIDQDGDIGEPEPKRFVIELSQQTTAGRRTAWLDIPTTPEQFAPVARAAVNGLSLSQDSWTGAGNPFSRAQWAALRDRLLELELLAWKDATAPRQGLELTGDGRRALAAWLRQFDADTSARA